VLARLIAVAIDEVRRELRALDDTEPSGGRKVDVNTVDTEPSYQPETSELLLRFGFNADVIVGP
jgi:hypothetical protein